MATRISVGRWTFEAPPRVFLDANFILALRVRSERYHAAAAVLFKKLLADTTTGRIALYISPQLIDEVWWCLARLLHENERPEAAWNRLSKAERKEAFQKYGFELTETTNLLRNCPAITITDVSSADISPALAHVTDTAAPLEPTDAFHLAVMERLDIEGIVTNDHDFHALPSIVALGFSIPDRLV
jgi:predicted nucleic acid-binding protein